MRRQRLRVEVRLEGEIHARYPGRYLQISRCGPNWAVEPDPAPRHDHNAGGKSLWMDGFFDRPAPPLWKSLG